MAENTETESFLDDTYASARELITERFSSPFIFSFVISWLIFNYKIVILALTDSSKNLLVIHKIDLIQSCLLSSTWTVPFINYPILLDGFICPLLAAAFYTFVYPFADYYITKFTTSRKVAIRNMRIEKEEKIFYRFKDVQKIYIKHAEDDKNSRERIERAEITEAQQNAVIKDLQAKLNEENNKKLIPSTEGSEDSSDVETKLLLASEQTAESKPLAITQNEIDIIALLAKANDSFIEWIAEKEILKIKGKTATDIKIALDDLINKGLINRDYRSSLRDYGCQLTVEGMKEYKKLAI